MLPVVGAIKVGVGRGRSMQPLLPTLSLWTRMTVLLPSMVLALLCMLQAGADVPVQPGFNAEKVRAQGAHEAGPAWAGWAAWGRVPMLYPQAQAGTLRQSPVPAPGQLPGRVDACAKLD